MLLKISTKLHDPGARCCWECINGNGGKPSKRKVITCDADGNPTVRLAPGHCDYFIENERGEKARRATTNRFKRDLRRFSSRG